MPQLQTPPAACAVRLTDKKKHLGVLGMPEEFIPQSRFPPPYPHKNLLVLGPTLYPTSGTGRNPNVRRAVSLSHLNFYPPCGDTSKKRKAPPETPKWMVYSQPVTVSMLGPPTSYISALALSEERSYFEVLERGRAGAGGHARGAALHAVLLP